MYMFTTCTYIQIYVYMTAYGHIYSCMHYFGTWEVCKTSSQRIHTQEAGV